MTATKQAQRTPTPWSIDQTDAAFIIRACTSHAALVAALRETKAEYCAAMRVSTADCGPAGNWFEPATTTVTA